MRGQSLGIRWGTWVSASSISLQAFIDQLIEDKKSISQKCEVLTGEMRAAERRSKENLKAMESRHNMEMGRLKQVTRDRSVRKRRWWMVFLVGE